jgi:hypothetical protein
LCRSVLPKSPRIVAPDVIRGPVVC